MLDADVLLREFLAEFGLEMRPRTVDHYREVLAPLFAAWRDTSIDEWSRAQFVQYATSRDWAPRTVGIARSCCRKFIEWCQRESIPVPDFVPERLGRRKHRPRHPKPLQPTEAAALLTAARGHVWLEVVVGLGIYAGLDRADISTLLWIEVDLEAGIISRTREKRA